MSDLGGPDTADDDLLAELGAAVRAAEEVPSSFLAAAEAAYIWRTLDSELTALTSDSAREPELAGVRAPDGGSRFLTFTTSAGSLELELRGEELHGQVDPPGPGSARVELRDGGLRAPVPVDEVGWFTASLPPTGEVRVHVRSEDGGALTTEWFQVDEAQ